MAENQNTENVELTEQDLTEQHRIRIEKLAELKANGKNPFEITKYDVNAKSEDIKADFENLEGKTVSIAGRMMNRRIMGKASFINIRDDIGNIQAYVRRDDIGEELYADFKKWDLGDIIGVEGFVFKTKTGEISIHAEKIVLLAKSLHPIPNEYAGFKDMEMRYQIGRAHV